MTLRRARTDDAARIDAFLARHAETSMFPRANLARFGAEGAGDHPNATRFWITEDTDGIAGVLGLTRSGTVLPQWPGLTAGLVAGWRAALSPAAIDGIVGDPDQIAPLAEGLGLTRAATRLDEAHDLYTLALADLHLPQGNTALRAPSPDEAARLGRWRAAYLTEVLAVPEAEAARDGPAQVAGLMGDDRLRVLVNAQDTPLAMTAFNATVADHVQVGGVYTPPAARGRGLARRAVALHLAEAHGTGAMRAILFAANAAAARAYVAIGFVPGGSFGFRLFDGPQEIAA